MRILDRTPGPNIRISGNVIGVPSGFIPALRFRILTPLYDSFMRVVMKEARLKSGLISRLELQGDEDLLDFGCGTGTLTLMIQAACPGCRVQGIDIDGQVLGIAREKARRRNMDIPFLEYDGITLPYADESFDGVITSLVLHHLPGEEKIRVLGEIWRVLRKGGPLHIMDFGVPRSRYARFMASVLRYFEPIGDNIRGRIPGFLRDAGFRDVEEIYDEETLFGTIAFWRAKRL